MDVNIITYLNPGMTPIRAFAEGGKLWIVAKDVCDALGYKNTAKAIKDHVSANNKLNNKSLSFLGLRGGWVLTERGVLEFTTASQKRSAEKFQDDFTRKMLPYFQDKLNLPTSDKDEEDMQDILSSCEELIPFNDQEFGTIRAIEMDGEPWLVGKDAAMALGYGIGKSLSNAIVDHVDDEDKCSAVVKTPGGQQEVIVINESGLYSLVLSSTLPGAKKFRRWITSEVLPSIRRHGMYAVDELIDNPELAIKAFTALKDEREKNRQLEQKVQDQGRQIENMAPKAKYYDIILSSPNLIAISKIAKDYGWNAVQMNRYLHEKRVQFKQGDTWLLYADYAAEGYTKIKTIPIGNGGYMKEVTYWTQKGRRFLYEFLKADGILPLIEKEQDAA